LDGSAEDVEMVNLSEKERKRLERAKRFGLDPKKPFHEDDGSTYVR
jgi:hypothetical protein